MPDKKHAHSLERTRMEEFISLQEAAKQFGVKADRLRRAAWDGRLEARLVGNLWLVLPDNVATFLRDGDRRRTATPSTSPRTGGSMARIIAVAVPKGGSGKTTTTLNLG